MEIFFFHHNINQVTGFWNNSKYFCCISDLISGLKFKYLSSVDSNSKDITVKVKDREEKILFEIKADINIYNIDIEELEFVQEKQNILVLINDETIVINIEK